MLQSIHGQELEQFWKTVFGYGYTYFTNIEAGYFSRVESFAAIRNRLAKGAELARGKDLSAVKIRAATP